MDENKFKSMLILIVPQVVGLICASEQIDETTATQRFYRSGVYAALEREETKVWHFSPLALFHLYEEERDTGSFTFPEEC